MGDIWGDNEDVIAELGETVEAENEFDVLAAEVAQDAAQVDFVTLAWRVAEEAAMYRELGKEFASERKVCERWLKAHDLTPAKVRKLKPRQPTLF